MSYEVTPLNRKVARIMVSATMAGSPTAAANSCFPLQKSDIPTISSFLNLNPDLLEFPVGPA